MIEDIDGFMVRGVLQALSPLSIHVTFTEIVPSLLNRIRMSDSTSNRLLKFHKSVTFTFSTYKTVLNFSSQQHSVGRCVSDS